MIVDKIDTDKDGLVTEGELRAWIKKAQKKYVYESVERQWQEFDLNQDGFISWDEYRNVTYGTYLGKGRGGDPAAGPRSIKQRAPRPQNPPPGCVGRAQLLPSASLRGDRAPLKTPTPQDFWVGGALCFIDALGWESCPPLRGPRSLPQPYKKGPGSPLPPRLRVLLSLWVLLGVLPAELGDFFFF